MAPEDGFLGRAEAVEFEPLEPADPDGHLREVVGVGVEHDAVELPWADHGEERGGAEIHRVQQDGSPSKEGAGMRLRT